MLLPQPQASDAVDRMYKANAAAQGFVMNLASAWAWRPDIFESFAALRMQLTSASSLSKRDQAVLVCAMAGQLGDSYCSLAWGNTLNDGYSAGRFEPAYRTTPAARTLPK